MWVVSPSPSWARRVPNMKELFGAQVRLKYYGEGNAANFAAMRRA